MPTYDYKCNACGHAFELFQQMSDAVKRKCPRCGKPKLERLIGIGAGVLFKGGGFYETDYRSDSYTKAAEADKKAAQAKTEPATNTDAAQTASNGQNQPSAAKAETPTREPAATRKPARKPARSLSSKKAVKARRKG